MLQIDLLTSKSQKSTVTHRTISYQNGKLFLAFSYQVVAVHTRKRKTQKARMDRLYYTAISNALKLETAS